jgi:hypothetical protein
LFFGLCNGQCGCPRQTAQAQDNQDYGNFFHLFSPEFKGSIGIVCRIRFTANSGICQPRQNQDFLVE